MPKRGAEFRARAGGDYVSYDGRWGQVHFDEAAYPARSPYDKQTNGLISAKIAPNKCEQMLDEQRATEEITRTTTGKEGGHKNSSRCRPTHGLLRCKKWVLYG